MTTLSQLCWAEKEIIKLSFSLFNNEWSCIKRETLPEAVFPPWTEQLGDSQPQGRQTSVFHPFLEQMDPFARSSSCVSRLKQQRRPQDSLFYLHRYSQSLFWKATEEKSISSLKEQETRREEIMRSIAGGVFSVHSSG